jgi:NitT/TauT family transport system substrate-binding protein
MKPWLIALALVLPVPTLAAQQTLALNWKAETQFGGFYAAKYSKAFERRQLDVNITEGGSGTPTVQMLAAGRVDYAIVSGDEIAIAHDRGADNVVALFAVYQTNPQCIMTHAARGFTKIDDVLQNDGTLLWQAGLPYAQYFRKKYAPIKVRSAPYPGGIGQFRHDPQTAQQCFITSEPLTAEDAGIRVKAFLVADSGYNPYTTVLATTRENLQAHPDEVRAMVEAVREGWSEYLKNPAATNAQMATLNKAVSIDNLNAGAKAQQPLIQTTNGKLGAMTTARWQQLVEQLQQLGIIRKAVSADSLFVDL